MMSVTFTVEQVRADQLKSHTKLRMSFEISNPCFTHTLFLMSQQNNQLPDKAKPSFAFPLR